MNALTVSDINIFNKEPTIVDMRLAETLGYENPYNIRKLINRNLDEMQRYGEVFSTVEKTSASGGRPASEFHLNEPQCLLICMKSDAVNAPDARYSIIKVFMDWRKGGHSMDTPVAVERITLEGEAPLMARVEAVKVAARLWGKERARSLWERLGLPAVPPASTWEGEGEAKACLAHLFAAVPPASDGRTLYRLILDALDGDENARIACLHTGIRIADDGEAFGVAHVADGLAEIFAGTQWQARGWRVVLKRIAGAVSGDTQLVGPARKASRIIWLPASNLDRTP